MTFKSEPKGQSQLKFYPHASFMGRHRYTNFHQNRRGSGTAVFDLTRNDPYLFSFCFIFMLTTKYENLYFRKINADKIPNLEFINKLNICYGARYMSTSVYSFKSLYYLFWAEQRPKKVKLVSHFETHFLALI